MFSMHLGVTLVMIMLIHGTGLVRQPLTRLFNRDLSPSTRVYSSSWEIRNQIRQNLVTKKEKWLNRFNGSPYTYTAVSFFHFVNKQEVVIGEETVQEITKKLKGNLQELGVRGTFLLSDEGYNAQLAIPTCVLDETYDKILSIDETLFSTLDMNVGKTLDYHPDEFLTEYERQEKEAREKYKKKVYDGRDEFADSARGFPFKKLIVRAKFAVLTDRMEGGENIDWTDAGPELEAWDWHNELVQSETKPLLLDCRNLYESDMGTFEGSVPLNTEKFSESWDKLDNLLEGVPKDQRVLTFCTGGIRCIKVNAYLKQKLGLTNVGRLKKGIIGYEEWMSESQEEGEEVEMVQPNESLFSGTNFLFDRRRLETGDSTKA